MHISHQETREAALHGLIRIEEEPHFDFIIELAWLGTLVFAFGFQCRPELRETKKRELLGFVTCQWSNYVDLLKKAEEYQISESIDSEDRQVTVEDLVCIRLIFDAHASRIGNSSEALVTWIDEAWEFGVQQRRVYECEEEGGVQNISGVVMNLAAHLSLSGAREGLLPAS